MRLLNLVNQEWWEEERLRPEGRRVETSIGKLAPEMKSYDIDEDFKLSFSPNDNVTVRKTLGDGTVISQVYEIVGPSDLRKDAKQVTFFGQGLSFAKAPLPTDALVGGDIIVPRYLAPALINEETDEEYVPECPNSNYLVYGLAASIAGADPFKANLVDDFNFEKDRAMASMLRDNSSTTRTIRRPRFGMITQPR